MTDMYGLEACLDSVTFSVEELHENVYEMLGRYVIRAEVDRFFNPMMIEACKKYIKDHNLGWDAKYIRGNK